MVKQVAVAMLFVVAAQAQAGVCSATNGVVVISASCKGNVHDQLLQAVKQHNQQQAKAPGYVTVRGVFDSTELRSAPTLGQYWSK